MKKNYYFSFLLAFLFFCIQCSSSPISSESDEFIGAYEMELLVEEDTTFLIPFLVEFEADFALVYEGGWIQFNPDNTFEMVTDKQTRFYSNGNEQGLYRFSYGTYELIADSVFLLPDLTDVYLPFTGAFFTENDDVHFLSTPYPGEPITAYQFKKLNVPRLDVEKKIGSTAIPYSNLSQEERNLFFPFRNTVTKK